VVLLQHELVPARREDAGRGGLADVAAQALAVPGQQVVEAADLAHADQVVQLLARIREVLAQVVVHAMPRLAISAFITWPTSGTQPPQVAPALVQALISATVQAPAAHGRADLGLGHVVARADLRRVGQRVHAEAGPALPSLSGQDQEFRVRRQRDAVERHLQQRAVLGRIADQHRAQQLLAVFADHDLLVDLLALVDVLVGARPGRLALGVADAGHVHAHELELGAHVGAGEGRVGWPAMCLAATRAMS
jgi:hypothetical protein